MRQDRSGIGDQIVQRLAHPRQHSGIQHIGHHQIAGFMKLLDIPIGNHGCNARTASRRRQIPPAVRISAPSANRTATTAAISGPHPMADDAQGENCRSGPDPSHQRGADKTSHIGDGIDQSQSGGGSRSVSIADGTAQNTAT